MLPRRTSLRQSCWVVGIDLPKTHDGLSNGLAAYFGHDYLDLSRFKELTSLERLNLPNAKRFGDIEVLRHNTKLKHLNLAGSEGAFGDLGDLRNLVELTYLNLGWTDIYGNLSSLKKATRLKKLILDNTDVDGDVMALEDATELTHLNLANTRVVGDLSRLRPVENDVSRTGITCKGQDDALREILLRLGLTRKNVTGIEWRMLS